MMGAIAQYLLQLPYKATFRPPLVYLRKPFFKTQYFVRKAAWLADMRKKGCKVHGSIEFRGHEKFAQFIKSTGTCVIERDCSIWIAEQKEAQPYLNLGEAVYIGRNVYLGVYQPLQIGQDTLIGAYSYIISGNHRFDDINKPIRLQGYSGKPVKIGRDVWIGCHVVILPGVSIGDGAIVSAGAVVNQNVPPFEIWGGVPARKLGSRTT